MQRTRRWSAWLAVWIFFQAGSTVLGAESVREDGAANHPLRLAEVGEPKQLRGWVSYSRPGWPGFYLETDHGGMYCELARISDMPGPGVELVVRGVVAEGRQRFLRVTEVELVGRRPIPSASECGAAARDWPRFLGRWCRVEGLVVGESRGDEGIQWTVATGGGLLWVRSNGTESAGRASRRWSRVQVDGVFSEEEVRGGGGWRMVFLVPEGAEVRELESREVVLNRLPVVEPGKWVRQGSANEKGVVRVVGVVTLVTARAIALEGGQGGVWCNMDEVSGVAPAELGHRMEVVGWRVTGGPTAEIRQAQVVALRGVGEKLPESSLREVSELRDPARHGSRVSLEGEVVHRMMIPNGDILVCTSGVETFEAGLEFVARAEEWTALKPGARVRVTGVARQMANRHAGMVMPRIVVARAVDLRVIQAPPWPAHWTAALISGMAVALGVGVVGMAVAYRRLRDTHRRLASTEGDLRRLNGELEGRVAAGVAELGRSNEQLREEVAQRRVALERVQDQERRLVEAQAIARTGSFHWDVTSDRLRWSQEMYTLCGVAPEAFVPSLGTWLACVHPDDRSRVEAGLRSAMETGRDLVQEHRIALNHGEVRWGQLRARVLARDNGIVEAVEGTCQDITDRKLVELALRTSESNLAESERRYRSLVEGTEVIVWEYDPVNAAFTYVSPQATRYGYTLDQWLEPGFWERSLHPEDRRAAMDYCDASVRQGSDHRLQYRMLTANGRVVWVDDVVTLDRRPEGGIILRGVFVDVTGLKEAEARRLHLESQLHQAQKLEAIGTVAGGVAHDFNNLLGIISGTADLVRRSGALPADCGESMDDILEASRRGRELVQRMLEFSRREEVRREPVCVGALAEESVRLLKAVCPASVEVVVTIQGGVPEIAGDPIQLQRVVGNLVTNAVQAIGPRQGRVEVEVSAHPGRAAAASATSAGAGVETYVRLRVTDDGPGMDSATLKRVFEPFFTTKGTDGTGLGLSVVHGVVRSHGGWVVVESQPGCGAIFDVYLPVPSVSPSRTR